MISRLLAVSSGPEVGRIEEFDAVTAEEQLLRGVHKVYVDLEADFIPGGLVTPFEQHRAKWQAPGGSHRKERRWAAMEDWDVVGGCHLVTWVDHEDTGLLVVGVRRDARRQGIGHDLVRLGLRGLEAEGRSKVIIDVPDGSGAEAGVKRLGLRSVLSEKISQLTISDIDWDLMNLWVDRAAERSGDYDLLFLDSPLPDEHLEKWSEIMMAMNTAPMEDLELEDFTMTPEKWRSVESNYEARGSRVRVCIAVHRPTGDFAGMTILIAQNFHPRLAWQDDTVVDPDHRDRGLGRLLKASLDKRFVAEFPDAEQIRTGNAGSNVPMLNINSQMGFRPVLLVNAWQDDIATALEALTI